MRQGGHESGSWREPKVDNEEHYGASDFRSIRWSNAFFLQKVTSESFGNVRLVKIMWLWVVARVVKIIWLWVVAQVVKIIYNSYSKEREYK